MEEDVRRLAEWALIGRSEGCSSAWVKVNAGWEVLNIEDPLPHPTPTPSFVQCSWRYVMIFLMFAGVGKDVPLAQLQLWCFHHTEVRYGILCWCLFFIELYTFNEMKLWVYYRQKINYKQTNHSYSTHALYKLVLGITGLEIQLAELISGLVFSLNYRTLKSNIRANMLAPNPGTSICPLQ